MTSWSAANSPRCMYGGAKATLRSVGVSNGCVACGHSVSARPSQKNQRLYATFQSDGVCR